MELLSALFWESVVSLEFHLVLLMELALELEASLVLLVFLEFQLLYQFDLFLHLLKQVPDSSGFACQPSTDFV